MKEIHDNDFFKNFKFDWDEVKSQKNLEHGRPSFSDIEQIFKNNYETTIQFDGKEVDGEIRHEILLRDNESKIWNLVFTMRKGFIRIITFHRKKDGEKVSEAKQIWQLKNK